MPAAGTTDLAPAREYQARAGGKFLTVEHVLLPHTLPDGNVAWNTVAPYVLWGTLGAILSRSLSNRIGCDPNRCALLGFVVGMVTTTVSRSLMFGGLDYILNTET